MKKFSKTLKMITVGSTILLLTLLVAGCKKSSDSTIVIYDGNFSEMKVIHQMVKQLVEGQTELTVEIKDEMSPVNSYKQLVKGSCDLMNSYDGTLLTTFLKMDVADVPEGEAMYDFVNKTAREKDDVYLLDKFGTNNTYALAVPYEIADQYNLNTISDVVPVAGELIFGAEHEFFSEEGSMKFNPFVKFYDLKFKEANPVDIGLKYSAVESGNIDVTVVYATDGLNKKANLKILEDDRQYFPEYNGALLVRADLFERFEEDAPDLKDILNQLADNITDAEMVDMTYAIDVDGKDVAEVAAEFLESKGLEYERKIKIKK